MYRSLDSEKILLTIDRLAHRIEERFPAASLGRVAQELFDVAQRTEACMGELARPNVLLRTAVGVLLLGVLGVLGLFLPEMRLNLQIREMSDLVQTIEALLGSLFFLGTGMLFLVTAETRIKRRKALQLVHELRALAHVIDMHQLTKDPELLIRWGSATASSPSRTLSDFELVRYLDYASEMLSLVSKVGALTVQSFSDPVVLSAVDEVESLTSGLSRKVWQKITIINQFAPELKKPPGRLALGGTTSGGKRRRRRY